MKILKLKTSILIAFIFLFSTCYNDSTENTKVKEKKIENIDFRYDNIKSMTIHFYGKVNTFPATVSLYIKNSGQKIRADFKSFDGKDSDLVSFFKINKNYYVVNKKKGLKIKRQITANDFLNFFYFPINHYLKMDTSKHFERYENFKLVNKNCQHLQMRTDTSQADFYVWQNILLKLNTEMQTGKKKTKVELQAKSLEENIPFPDSLFKIKMK